MKYCVHGTGAEDVVGGKQVSIDIDKKSQAWGAKRCILSLVLCAWWVRVRCVCAGLGRQRPDKRGFGIRHLPASGCLSCSCSRLRCPLPCPYPHYSGPLSSPFSSRPPSHFSRTSQWFVPFPFSSAVVLFIGEFIPAHLRHLPAVSALQKGQRPQRVRQGHRSHVCTSVQPSP